jgi:hypothetical protein
LRRRAALGKRNLSNLFDEFEIVLKVLCLETRHQAAQITVRHIVRLFELASQEAASEWAVGYESYAKLAHGCQELDFRIAGPQRILGL